MIRGRSHPGPQGEPEAHQKKCTDVVSSLRKCNKRRTNLRVEFDATSEAMQVVTDAASGRELEHRLNSLQTSLTKIERAITRYENIIEDCRMQEEEACQEEEIFHKQEGGGGHRH